MEFGETKPPSVSDTGGTPVTRWDFSGWTAAEISAYTARKARLDTANAARNAGGDNTDQAAAAGVSYVTIFRARNDWALAQESGDARLFLSGKSTGRPPLCDWPAEDVQTIRETYLRTNRGEDAGSMSMAVRICRHQGKLTPETTALLKRPASSKHYIPPSLRKELMISPAVRRHHRHPTNATLSGPYVPGTTRLCTDLSRRLYYGERLSFDDGSQNLIVCVPWPWGGTPEADRYGIRTCRGQWLLAHDDATSAIAAWVFTLRPRDSYRDPDALGLVYRCMRDVVKPDEAVCEGGVWQSKRAQAFHRAAGVRVIDAKGRPHLKLIENWFNRAWTFLSHYPDGQIGRFRAEMQRESDLLMRCRSGAVDGRRHFIMLPDLLREFDECIAFLDQDQVESDLYGKWVPAERRALDLAAHPRGRLEADLSAFAAPEVHVVTVQRGGMVLCKTTCPLGIPHPYEFMDERLAPLERVKVRVLYDPFEPVVCAAIVAERSFGDYKAGDLICMPFCINPPPAPVAEEGWQVLKDVCGLADGIAAKRAMGTAVRTEYRALRQGGRRQLTEIRGPDGARLRSDSGAGVADGATVDLQTIETRRDAASTGREDWRQDIGRRLQEADAAEEALRARGELAPV